MHQYPALAVRMQPRLPKKHQNQAQCRGTQKIEGHTFPFWFSSFTRQLAGTVMAIFNTSYVAEVCCAGLLLSDPITIQS